MHKQYGKDLKYLRAYFNTKNAKIDQLIIKLKDKNVHRINGSRK